MLPDGEARIQHASADTLAKIEPHRPSYYSSYKPQPDWFWVIYAQKNDKWFEICNGKVDWNEPFCKLGARVSPTGPKEEIITISNAEKNFILSNGFCHLVKQMFNKV